MDEFQAELLVDCQNELGEGVQWRAQEQRVYWTDIINARLLSCDEFGNDLKVQNLPERLCAFAFDPDGNILGAFASGFYRFNLVTAQRDLLIAFEPDRPGTRLNDGRCDPAGRFICGGYDEGDQLPNTSVVSYHARGIKTLITEVTCANSINFSIDGTRLYFADSFTKDILCYDYDLDTGTLSNKAVFATLGDDEGAPDGSVVDARDGLWNAQYGGGCVQQFHDDGARGSCVRLPVPNVTCACFGGRNLDKMFITTARENLDDQDLKTHPTSGGLFVVKPGATGRLENGLKDHLFPG